MSREPVKEVNSMKRPILPLSKKEENKEEARICQWLLKEPELQNHLSTNNGGQCEPEMLLRNSQTNAAFSLKVPLNMINLTWAEKGKWKATWELKAERRPTDRPTEGTLRIPEKPKATIVKGVVLCSKCHSECELEIPAAGAIMDRELIRMREKEKKEKRISTMRARELETSRNVFQRLGGDSQPKNLSEVFRNYEASEEVEDKEAKVPRWKEVRLPQPGYTGGDVRMKGRMVDPTIKMNLTRLGRRWFVVGKDGKPVKEIGASMIRRVQRQHKTYMNSLKNPAI